MMNSALDAMSSAKALLISGLEHKLYAYAGFPDNTDITVHSVLIMDDAVDFHITVSTYETDCDLNLIIKRKSTGEWDDVGLTLDIDSGKVRTWKGTWDELRDAPLGLR
jgi:hypothetical protein